MKKLLIIIFIVVVLGIIGFEYYWFNSPFTLSSVKMPTSINTFTQANLETMGTYLVTRNGENFINLCNYVTYNPESSLNRVYICEPKGSPENSLNSWRTAQMDFLNQGGQKFSSNEQNINGVNVKTVTISNENCGNPGFCTTYYWKQGKIIFSSNTRQLVEGFIEVN